MWCVGIYISYPECNGFAIALSSLPSPATKQVYSVSSSHLLCHSLAHSNETFMYHPRDYYIKISEADGSSSTVAAAINLMYWLLPPSLDRLGRFAQLFQRWLLSIAVFLSHILLTHHWTIHSALGLIAHMVGRAVCKMEADRVVGTHCQYPGQVVLFSPVKHSLCLGWEM